MTFGTRTNTVVLVDANGHATYVERTMDEDGTDPDEAEWRLNTFEFDLIQETGDCEDHVTNDHVTNDHVTNDHVTNDTAESTKKNHTNGTTAVNGRFSALAEENPEEPRKPVSDFGRRGHFRTGEQEKALEAIPAETLPKNIEFGLEQADSSSQHFARIQDELRTLILKKKARNKDVLKWIDKNVSAADAKEASFIRALVTVICEDTMDRDSGQCKCHFGRLRDRKKLLQRYIGGNTDLELQALYAVQALFVQLDYPPGFIKSYFDSFYDEELVTEETFNVWESSSEEERGKGLAVTACSEFFAGLEAPLRSLGKTELTKEPRKLNN
ncbi:regulation of mRNA cap binding [Desmophyllum pertusum]|uniref:Regulation of mRNA cap binding n=1 Tax=Desmophyllum pertusum TaxID=174260 RepID=A0A9X0CT87_9CNID|nr:regulation of mRNA cap binding [Desmophyllum pertusum]